MYLNHLRFADAIVLISGNIVELEQMLTDLARALKTTGVQMNYRKTKIMSDSQIKFQVNQQPIENVPEVAYLRQLPN